jgi:hypothetical protein
MAVLHTPFVFSRVLQEQAVDYGRVNSSALAALPAILARLLPGGKFVAGEYTVLNPRRSDKRAGSFKINMRSGRWCDFATGDKGGDVVSLVAFLEDVSQYEAARLLSQMLGVR